MVQVRARSELDDAALRGFAQAIAMALPVGGETPALVKRLPPDGLVERSAVFFHEEISIQNKLWLGGENVLGTFLPCPASSRQSMQPYTDPEICNLET